MTWRERGPGLSAALLAVGTFAADVHFALGAAVAPFYELVILHGLWSRRRRFAVWAAVFTTMLIAVDALLAAPAPAATFTRTATLLATWTTAVLVELYKGAEAERRLAETKLRDQEALARLGQLAAVVAHEVRNPLAGIKGTLQILADRLSEDGSDRHAVRVAIERLDQLNDLTRDLLTFARPRDPEFADVRLRAVVSDAVALLGSAEEAAAVDVVVEGDDPLVRADARLLRDVAFNLLLNAAQAQGGAGTVRVRLHAAGRRCRIDVEDAGPGLAPEHRERVFEPFFTTRHRGTGLGLAIVKRYVEAHGGEVTLRPAPGGGTVASVELPAAGA